MSDIQVINIKDKLSKFSNFWSPKVAGELNGQEVKVAKLRGEFVWHHHESADELFLVIKGVLIIHFRDGDVTVNEGEFVIIPRLVEHKPEANEEVHIVLIEPKGTLNTGNVKAASTVVNPDKI